MSQSILARVLAVCLLLTLPIPGVAQEIEADLYAQLRYPNLLYSKLSVLAGDVAANLDEAPKHQQREVHALLRERMETRRVELDEVLATHLPAFNGLLRERGLSGLVPPKPDR